MAMNIKKGDTIVVLSGKDKGKQGKVLGTVPKSTKIVAEGINKSLREPGTGSSCNPCRATHEPQAQRYGYLWGSCRP